ncbi:hypothetical protein T36_1313 [Helicobacter cinaedi]|uniref:hypothetical protein n=1 Tax=Helicobacter cinaedi TaxID=213 RepID=UPI001F15D60A|nr:hypothetical protein [Helicobacter cinaedi]BDB64856.1 hypothetical protein T36_1313 [Helicobacter cinaedi]
METLRRLCIDIVMGFGLVVFMSMLLGVVFYYFYYSFAWGDGLDKAVSAFMALALFIVVFCGTGVRVNND